MRNPACPLGLIISQEKYPPILRVKFFPYQFKNGKG
jgi:hypothetical protein